MGTPKDHNPEDGKSREQLVRELAELRIRLASEKQQHRNMYPENTKDPWTREKEYREIELINRILGVFIVARGDELFSQVLDIVREGLGSRHGIFGYLAAPGHLVCPSLTVMLDACEVAGKCIHYPKSKWKGLWSRALLEKRSFYNNELQPVPKGHPAIHNNLAAPVLFQGEAIGLLNLANKEGGYTESDRLLVDSMAERIAPLLYAWIQKKLREEERAKNEAELRRSERRVRRVLDSVLSPEGDLGVLELADLIDTASLQKLLDDFHAVARIPMSIIDIKGRVLVGVGWQDVCTRFHRVHPETSRHCLESDTSLSTGLAQGEFRLYKCRNHMWDMATPIYVADQHVGNVFTGQFFFEDETVDRELFRAQAAKYGFNEEEYLAALDRVPRLSRKTVDRGMSFFLKLADTLSQLSYSNVKLARLLTERDRLTASLRQSRAKLEAALASMTDAVCISDAEARFIDFNDAFATFHRFGSKDECPKTLAAYPAILEIFTPEGQPAPPDQWVIPRALRGETATHAEYRLRRKDTGETWVGNYSFGPIRDRKGAIVGAVMVGRDITERKRTEENIRKLNDTLEQQVIERTELAETRARQLRGLAVELIEAEEKERRRIAQVLHDDLQQILASARMQLHAACETLPSHPLLENVIALLKESISKSRRLSHELSPPVLYRADLVAALEWLARQMDEQFGLKVALEAEAIPPVKNAPMKLLLFRAVQELLFNTVKHAGVKAARVVLSGSADGLAIAVSDSGRGFDPDILRSSNVKAGLGLMSLRERVRSVGGSLVIKSAPGQGSRFILSIPFRFEAETHRWTKPAADRQSLVPEVTEHAMDATGIRVLFADDHKVMRQGLIQLMAGQPDIQVVGEAANGCQALELTRQLKPDVVVMDVSMPEMDGVEATRRIKAEMPRVRVIGLSMFDEEHIAQTMRQAGAEAFMSKTASSTELLKAIYGMDRQNKRKRQLTEAE